MRILLLMILWSVTAYAELICVNPTTQFYLRKDRLGHKLYLGSPYGTKFTPVYDGQVPPVAMSQIGADAEVLEKLGTKVEILFGIGSCEQVDNLVTCKNGKMLTTVPFEVGSIRLSSSVSREKSLSFDYEYLKMTLTILLDGVQYQISSRYDPKTCTTL